MKIYSEITGKWYDSPGECLVDEAKNDGDAKKEAIKQATNHTIGLVLEAHEYVKAANMAMLHAAIALVELHEMGGDMVKITDIPIHEHSTMMQTILGIRKNVDLLSTLNSLKDKIDEMVAEMSEEEEENEEEGDFEDYEEDDDNEPDYPDDEEGSKIPGTTEDITLKSSKDESGKNTLEDDMMSGELIHVDFKPLSGNPQDDK